MNERGHTEPVKSIQDSEHSIRMGKGRAKRSARGSRYVPGTIRPRTRGRRHLARRAVLLLTALFAAVCLIQVRERGTGGLVPEKLRWLEEARSTMGRGNSAVSPILVNKAHPLPDSYEVELHWLNNGSCAVAEEMYDALRRMLTDGSTDGRAFVVASGYRDRKLQQQLLEEDIAADMELYGMSWQEAYEKETQETMPPGCSEHETGLAVDLVSLSYQTLDAGQEATPENQWLRENCSRYGFILRYPRGKEEVTGVSYESWHFRYVGEELAERLTRQGLTLEEYLDEIGGEDGWQS